MHGSIRRMRHQARGGWDVYELERTLPRIMIRHCHCKAREKPAIDREAMNALPSFPDSSSNENRRVRCADFPEATRCGLCSREDGEEEAGCVRVCVKVRACVQCACKRVASTKAKILSES